MKIKRVYFVTLILLNISIICFSGVILYKTFWRINMLPSAVNVLIGDKIDYCNKETDINKLKQFSIAEFENRKKLIFENDKYINTIFGLGITVLVFCFGFLFLLLKLRKYLKD
ncbi:MAG: hypothetical protein JNL24_11720 [Bacteroidia bacterium]|nr:hypothetical protein [Bacteroidia bacterium]